MNILMLASDDNNSGAFRSMTTLSKLIKKNGNNITVVMPSNGEGEELLKENNIDYQIVRSESWIVPQKFKFKRYLKTIIKIVLYNYKAIKKIQKIIREKDIDIVHLNTSWCYVGAIAAKKEKTKLVWHIREFLEEDQNCRILFKKWGYKLINSADKIICISKSVYEKYKNIFDSKKIEIVHNGIDTNLFYNCEKKIFNNDAVKMICVGRITQKKGQRDIVEAICQNASHLINYNVSLDLYGGFDEKEKDFLEKKIKENGIENIIVFKGRSPNINKVYKNYDISFMCSSSEAFGRVTVEAMLSGCLEIGKDCAATSEIIKDNETGLLYNNTKELADKIIYALNNKNRMKKVAESGREYVKNNFSAEQNANNIIKIYEAL